MPNFVHHKLYIVKPFLQWLDNIELFLSHTKYFIDVLSRWAVHTHVLFGTTDLSRNAGQHSSASPWKNSEMFISLREYDDDQ